MGIEWKGFNPDTTQELPDERKLCLCMIKGEESLGMPPSVAVGYLRYAAGEKSCPFWVVPGFGRKFIVVGYADILPYDLNPPLWPGFQRTV